jgi:hypothetical protein
MKILHLVPIVLTALPLAAFSQSNTEGFGPSAGDREVTIAGTGSNDKNFDHGSWGLSASYGWFTSENWAWVLRQSFNYADLPGDNVWWGSTRIGGDYHFGTGRLRPFIGANIGMIYGDVDDTGIVSPELGIKYYVKPETFVYLQTEYQFFFDDMDEIDDNFDDGAFVHAVGVGFNF